MKIPAFFLALAFGLMPVLVSAAEPAALDDIIAQRGAILTELLDNAKARKKSGRASCTDVHLATVELYTFRRDSAKTPAEKVEWQKSLVTEAQEYATDCQKRATAGVMTSVDQ